MSPTSGSGTGTPISSGVGASGFHVSPLPYTHLPLAQYAKIMGLNPAHFMRAYAPSLNPVIFPIGTCSTIWPRYNWQSNDQVSHEELAYAIKSAEDDLVAYLGYHPAPTWIEQEFHTYPRIHNREYFDNGTAIRGDFKTIETEYKKVIAPGRRALSLVGTATTTGGSLTFKDYDGDGLAEVAEIVMATAYTNANEIKVYFSGMQGAPEWEIRPAKSKRIADGIATIMFDAWLFIDPELLAAFPTEDSLRAIDISTTTNYVSSVDVYREYNDTSQVAAEFYWQIVSDHPCEFCSGIGCAACFSATQDGTFYIQNSKTGVVTPAPGSYDALTGSWRITKWLNDGVIANVEPTWLKIWYYSGNAALSDFWARIIADMASARLTRPLCGCNSAKDMAERMAEDLSYAETGSSYFTPVELLRNPFGTRRGELLAWRKVSRLAKDRKVNYALL